MPDPRAAAEEGEVEDGELPLSGSTSNGSGYPYRSTGLSINGASKKPSIQIGLNKGIPARPHVKASLFDEDSSSTRLSPGGAGLSIKGAAAGPSSGPSSAPNPTNGFSIKGRSSGNNGDLSQHEGEAESSASSAPSQNMTAALQSAGHGQSSTPVVSSHLSIKGANAAGLPPKPRTSMALPFKSKASAAKPVASGPAPNAYSLMSQQLPSNAIGKAYGNAMLVPKMAPAQPVSEPGPSYTPPRRISIPTAPSFSQRPLSPEPRPPSSSPPPPPPPAPVPSQALHAPSSASPSLTSGQWAAGAQKGKGKEEEDGEELEEGEELPDDSEDKAESHDKLALGVIPTPYQDSFATKSSDKLLMDADDDDRRRASFGRSQGDRWESSYRSPRNSRYDERDYSSSSRRYHRDDSDRRSRRKDEDDYYYRRSGYESYEDDYDDRNRSRHSRDARPSERDRDRREHRHHDRDRSRERERERDKDYSGRDREDRSYRSSRHGTTHDRKGNVWRRGSSYSPDPDSRKSPRREPNFHDEPGAPRHFDRELASVRKSLPSTPSLPAKPVAGLPARPDSARKDVPAAVVPLPQVATPFFLPSPPPPERKTVTAWEDEEAPVPDMAGIVGAGSASSNVDVKKYTLFGASSLSQYILEEKLGEGTFGVVHKARRKEGSVTSMPITEHDRRFRKALKRKKRHCETHSDATTLGCSRVSEGDVVALKKIVMHNDMDGVPITALREIRILKTLNHPNVVPVVDMAYQSGDMSALRRGAIYMVFPYMAHDLAGLLENKKVVGLDQSLLKLYAKQLLLGTSYLHRNKILHRDMKAANLLLSDNGVLQIADFGLARSIENPSTKTGKRREYTNCVVTRWYRPPELLLGLRAYGPPIDMWGVGCVIGEMFFRHPIFTGSSDLDQISRIVQMCGTVDDTTMPGWSKLPESSAIQVQRGNRNVKREFSRFSDELADLLDKLLVYDTETRLTADQALDHDWFWTEPLPAEVGSVQAFPSSHEYDKRKAAEERQGQGGEKARAAQEAAFKGPNQAVRIPAAPVPQAVHIQAQPQQPMMPAMQTASWSNQQQIPRLPIHNQAPPMMHALPPRPGLPPRPMAPQGNMMPQAYPVMGQMGGYSNGGMGLMQSQAQPMSYSQASSMRQQDPFPPNKTIAIAGRSNDIWGQSDPAAKRPRLAEPPGRLKMSGRSRMGEHADNLGGPNQAYRPSGQRQNVSAYDGNVPAGSAEPMD